MGDSISDEVTTKIAENKIEGTIEDKKNNSSKIKKRFAQLIVDFNIIPYAIGFAIAITFAEFMQVLAKYIISIYFKKYIKNEPILKFFTFILVLLMAYIFGYYVFYKLIYTEDIAKQTIIKKAINEKKEEEIKKNIEKDPQAINQINKTSNLNIEGFQFNK